MTGLAWHQESIPSLQSRDRLRKLACLFAGLGHLQPLLLATTNSHYLLDRFCMERCCSGEYISRIVTSLIFMEILATLIVAPTGVCIGIACCSNPSSGAQDAQGLVTHIKGEERYRDPISITVQLIISLGYMQILISFMTGGRKGHMHWFYSSMILQYFLICLIAGGIGFWDVEHALWYLMAIPVGPVVVFFYQLYIHSWIRNNGPRYVEYIVVEWQIFLATALSILATACWTYGYYKHYEGATLTIPANLNSLNSQAGITVQPKEEIILITQGSSKTIPIFDGTITLNPGQSKGTITIKVYSVTLEAAGSDSGNAEATIYPRKVVTLTLNSEGAGNSGTDSVNITLTAEGSLSPKSNKTNVTLKLTAVTGVPKLASGVAETNIYSGYVQFNGSGSTGGANVNIKSVTISSLTTSKIDPAKTTASAQPGQTATAHTIVGIGCYPNPGYYISGTNESSLWKEEWDGGKCEFVECYYKDTGTTQALLRFHVRFGGSIKIYYCGTNNAGNTSGWKTLVTNESLDTRAEDKEKAFLENFNQLITTGSFTLNGSNSPSTVYDNKHNTDYRKAITEGKWELNEPWKWKFTPIKYPLIMQGLSVGAVGSIFPNLIPKTLVCPKTTRTLSVINMFLVTVPHIINLALADNGWPSWSPGNKWEGWPGGLWPCLWSLYIFYIMAFLFAIFNVHYPDWRLCGWIRNRTWFIFLMTLFTNVLNEVFNAISRGGIMTQRSAKDATGGGQGKLLNHPLLWNKMACLMSLSYLPFWLTTTPMMKSYVSSLDPFLCDKDRDHWPTARYGRLRSFGYWCKCACRGLYNSPRKLITLDMRKALTRKDPPLFYILYGVLLMVSVDYLEYHTHLITFDSLVNIVVFYW